MSNKMKFIGMLATLVILIMFPIYYLQEPINQQNLIEGYHISAVISGTDLYAENCALCHGAAGEGIGDNPALNSDGIRTMSESDLEKTITRGRVNTLMAAWGIDEGGIFSHTQIDDLITLIQKGNWEYVDARVAELGLTPPELLEYEVPEELLVSLLELPNGDVLGSGLTIFAENCAACHNANGAGSVIAPAIDSAELRSRPSDEVTALVNNGVPGTLMTAWENMLSPEEINSVVDLIFRWPELLQAGVEFPEVEMASIQSSPEMIADGDRLFHITCKACHGVTAYGTPMAPALNNQVFLSQTPDAAIYQIIAGGISETLMPAWGSRLTDYELQTLVAYLRSLEETSNPIIPPILE